MRPSRPPQSSRRILASREGTFVLAAALLAASILLVVGPGTSQPVEAQSADLRTVTMRVAADDAYRTQPKWEANLPHYRVGSA